MLATREAMFLVSDSMERKRTWQHYSSGYLLEPPSAGLCSGPSTPSAACCGSLGLVRQVRRNGHDEAGLYSYQPMKTGTVIPFSRPSRAPRCSRPQPHPGLAASEIYDLVQHSLVEYQRD